MKYIVILFFINVFSSCYYDKDELLYGTTSCDTVNVRYSVQIKNILQTNCFSCHGGNALNGGGIKLGDYASLKAVVDGGSFLNAVTRSVNTMPKGAAKLPDCNIAEIRVWIRKGAPNN
jgi:mono/diheme cytochrome c family protein